MVREVGSEITALSLHCFTDGRESLERVVTDRLTLMTEEVGGMIRQWTLNSALSQLRVFLASLSVSEDQIRDLVVTMEQGRVTRRHIQERLTARSQTQTETTEPTQTPTAPQPRTSEPEAMEVTEVQPQAPTVLTEIPPPGQEAAFPASLLSVPVLSSDAAPSPDLGPLPASWLPIITR